MSHKVYCVKFKREMEGLDEAPQPDELGKRIFENVSKEAWKLWLRQQIMLINEYRLNLMDPEAQKFLDEQMEAFFFGEGSEFPPGYIPQPAAKK